MSKRVDVPANAKSHSKLVEKEFVTQSHLVDDILVKCSSLVVHRPSAVDEFELASRHEGTDRRLFRVSLLLPPPFEERNLYVDEFTIGVLFQCFKPSPRCIVLLRVESDLLNRQSIDRRF